MYLLSFRRLRGNNSPRFLAYVTKLSLSIEPTKRSGFDDKKTRSKWQGGWYDFWTFPSLNPGAVVPMRDHIHPVVQKSWCVVHTKSRPSLTTRTKRTELLLMLLFVFFPKAAPSLSPPKKTKLMYVRSTSFFFAVIEQANMERAGGYHAGITSPKNACLEHQHQLSSTYRAVLSTMNTPLFQ